MANAKHRDPAYIRDAQTVRDQANRNPHTLCWRCGQPAQPGNPWEAGHTGHHNDLAPEHRKCNREAGGHTRWHPTPHRSPLWK